MAMLQRNTVDSSNKFIEPMGSENIEIFHIVLHVGNAATRKDAKCVTNERTAYKLFICLSNALASSENYEKTSINKTLGSFFSLFSVCMH